MLQCSERQSSVFMQNKVVPALNKLDGDGLFHLVEMETHMLLDIGRDEKMNWICMKKKNGQ